MKKWEFGINNNYLVDLVLSGKKRATTSLYDSTDIPVVGEESFLTFSDGMLKKLEERHISDNITIINKSFFEYEFGKDIDAVISTQALHHFEPCDKEILYKKVYDCLKTHGIFIIEDYFAIDDETERKGFEDYRNLIKGLDSHYDTPVTIPHEIDILKKSGFSDVEHFVGDNFNILISKK